MIKKLNKMRAEKGFTLAELLVVVLIIAILATVAIVFFTGQTDKAQNATDAANLRAAYGATQNLYLENDGSYITPGVAGATPKAQADNSVIAAIQDETSLTAGTSGNVDVTVDMTDGGTGKITVAGQDQNLPS